jgi:NhaA family Na+:H+ antiporter
MQPTRPIRLDPTVSPDRDHVLGNPHAVITLVEYGSYACPDCHAAHEVILNLRDRYGDRLRYVFRHLPLPTEAAHDTAMLAELADQTTDEFWDVHSALMERGPKFLPADLKEIARSAGMPADQEIDEAARQAATAKIEADIASARRSGAIATPTFFINDRRYEGPWDESAMSESMVASLGHRVHTAMLDFARWAPSSGLLLLVMSVLAVVLTNSPLGERFVALWELPAGFTAGGFSLSLSLLDWVNHGLLTIFFLVVGLEIKRELTVGELATKRAAALPVAASIGGMVIPALLYLLVIGGGPWQAGWGMTIATDTAFAVALIVLLGNRVPVALRVFLTAAVIVDDLAAIAVIAIFYTGGLNLTWLFAAVGVTVLLVILNRWNVYRALPYVVLGLVLWLCLHEGGLHATLAGVVLATVMPTRPPANLRALMSQAQMVLKREARDEDGAMRHGPSEPALRKLELIHERIESPASRLLHNMEPWSSYVVLPVFALANAGVIWYDGIVDTHLTLMLAITLGLVVGKPIGIFMGAWIAVRIGWADKPTVYSWRQLLGAGALAGIGFTMSLFIASASFSDPTDFAAAKIAIFGASILAGLVGTAMLLKRPQTEL